MLDDIAGISALILINKLRLWVFMRLLHAFLFSLFVIAPAFATSLYIPATLMLEDMTSPEIRDALAAGYTTVIIPTGGTEQNGPHIALGKHNFILRYTALATAQRVGKTLIAPIMPYVPEGNIHPPTGHMRFAGTLSIAPDAFGHFLEDTARSLKEHGFKNICFLGEHGASQPVQKAIADKLTAEWKNEDVRVIQVGDYYDEHNGQNAWLKQMGEKEVSPQAHGGLADTSEMLAINENEVRKNLIADHTEADMDKTGAAGSSTHATHAMGAKLLELKVTAAVKQIQKEMQK